MRISSLWRNIILWYQRGLLPHNRQSKDLTHIAGFFVPRKYFSSQINTFDRANFFFIRPTLSICRKFEIEENYRQIKADVKQIVAAELQRIENDPKLKKLLCGLNGYA